MATGAVPLQLRPLPFARVVICRAIILAAAISCAVAFTAAGQAQATPVSCGEVITHDTTLEHDLTCPGKGIVIGADGITLDLNGHEVRSSSSSSCFDCPGLVGIDNSGGYDRVRILNGRVSYFSETCREQLTQSCSRAVVLVGADKNRLAGLTIPEAPAGVGILLSDSDNNKISASSIGGFSLRNTPAVQLRDGSDDNELVDSRFGGSPSVEISDSSGNRLARDTLVGRFGGLSLDSARGTTLFASQLTGIFGGIDAVDTDGSLISHNQVVEGNPSSISGDRNRFEANDVQEDVYYQVNSPRPFPAVTIAGGDANVVRGNSISGGFDDLIVEPGATNTLVEANLATQIPVISPLRNPDSCLTFFVCDDGIHVDAPGTIVRANTATDNDDLGIEAVPGVIDGGGNRASGNGNPLQCLNVVCR